MGGLEGFKCLDRGGVHLLGHGGTGFQQAELDQAGLQLANARPAHAGLQGRTFADARDRPALLQAQRGQLGLQEAIAGLDGGQLVEAGRDGSAFQRIGQHGGEIALAARGGPVGLDRDRIELAIEHVGRRRHPRIGGETVAFGEVGARRLKRGEVIMGRLEAVIGQALEGTDEGVIGRVIPDLRGLGVIDELFGGNRGQHDLAARLGHGRRRKGCGQKGARKKPVHGLDGHGRLVLLVVMCGDRVERARWTGKLFRSARAGT